jgi:class 3 adenylate cyclase
MLPGENTRIVAILFTDIEGSTLHWEEDAERMRSALARHDQVSREAVEACRGTVLEMMGDGMYERRDGDL